jgi:putative membrane protein
VPIKQAPRAFWAAIRNNVIPGEYYAYALWRSDRRANIDSYLYAKEGARLFRLLNRPSQPNPIDDKLAFYQLCKTHDIPTPAVLAAFGVTSCQKPGAQAARENTDLTSQKILSIDNEDFLVKAEKAEIRQTTLSQVALDKSNDEDVRQFARRVITNYHRALEELTDLRKAKRLAASSAAIEGLQLDALNRLHSPSGSAFDHQFISLMTAEQQEALAIFNSAAETAADPDIRNYAKAVLPLLREDFDTAAALEKKFAAKDRR